MKINLRRRNKFLILIKNKYAFDDEQFWQFRLHEQNVFDTHGKESHIYFSFLKMFLVWYNNDMENERANWWSPAFSSSLKTDWVQNQTKPTTAQENKQTQSGSKFMQCKKSTKLL